MAEIDTTELDRLVRELSIVHDELAALGDADFERRFQLKQRQDELRRQVARFHVDADAGRSRAELENELAALEAKLKSIKGSRIDMVQQAGGGSHGGDMGAIGIPKLNRAIEDAQGAGQVKARIEELKRRLEERDGE